MDYSLPGSSVYGIFQARILEQVAIPFSRGSSQTRGQAQVSCIARKFFTIWATREVFFFPHYSTSTPMKTSHCFLVLGWSRDLPLLFPYKQHDFRSALKFLVIYFSICEIYQVSLLLLLLLSRQSCQTLCDPIDSSPADSFVPGIL